MEVTCDINPVYLRSAGHFYGDHGGGQRCDPAHGHGGFLRRSVKRVLSLTTNQRRNYRQYSDLFPPICSILLSGAAPLTSPRPTILAATPTISPTLRLPMTPAHQWNKATPTMAKLLPTSIRLPSVSWLPSRRPWRGSTGHPAHGNGGFFDGPQRSVASP